MSSLFCRIGYLSDSPMLKSKTLEDLLAEAAASAATTVPALCERFRLNERTLRRLRREHSEARPSTLALLALATGQEEDVVRKAITASRRKLERERAARLA